MSEKEAQAALLQVLYGRCHQLIKPDVDAIKAFWDAFKAAMIIEGQRIKALVDSLGK